MYLRRNVVIPRRKPEIHTLFPIHPEARCMTMKSGRSRARGHTARSAASFVLSLVLLVTMATDAPAQETVSDELLEILEGAPQDDGAGVVDAAPPGPETGGLTLNINRVRNGKGMVIVLVYDDAAAFAAGDTMRAAGVAEVEAESGTVHAEFSDLTIGPTAVFVFHDENGDSDFAMTAGYPGEGFGYSKSAGAFGTPEFDTAAVAPGTIEIRMHYLPPRSAWERPDGRMRR
jgi:uncharacterized protein (DUF2141 family)